ncbi:hypothetical protein SEA_FIREMAN_93 [Microbacterium phage Fireman]|uniref:Uncharacterized protein n=2 Tax=Metamorphoovirus TaxID=2733195 RepID=A0A481VX12_9CAUD|nr:hypothetical protein HOT43_gp98 [Microbacterium phage RobsFeet]YP_009820330.1 hypothetical protein HOV22_gp95 [Microbacterium phage Fireman]AWY06102.1 hypothetical protein SEA_ROBSFEET_96 [Microbacterium phage RobsFeet]QBI98175.1 hypothetical protein SEA_FIREMAN_93 [Microbacterium phage Fireman]
MPDPRDAEAVEMQRLHDAEVARIEQSNDISGIIMNATKNWVMLDDRFAIADELWRLGYRLTRVEHMHFAPLDAAPGITVVTGGLQAIEPTPAATHRRRVYEGPWEPMPDGETAPADGVTYSQDGQP